MSESRTPAPARLILALPVAFWVLLTILSLWRIAVIVAGMFSDATSFRWVINWRRLDELLPWVAMGFVLLTREGALRAKSVRAERLSRLLVTLLLVGAGLTTAAVVLEQIFQPMTATRMLGGVAELILFLIALALAGGQMQFFFHALGAAPGKPPGITILDLWRFAATQWMLLLAVILLYFRATKRTEDILGSESIRMTLFLLPAAGVLPNALMAASIQLWRDIFEEARVQVTLRVRAWMAALIAINLAGLTMVINPRWLGVALGFATIALGSVLAFAGMTLFLLGFPSQVWRGIGGKCLLAAWLFLTIAGGAAQFDRLLALTQAGRNGFFGAAWRHLWIDGGVLWLLGMAAVAGDWLNGGMRERSRRLALLAGGAVLLGAVLMIAVFLLAAVVNMPAAMPGLLLLGALPGLAAMLVAGLWLRSAGKSRGGKADQTGTA